MSEQPTLFDVTPFPEVEPEPPEPRPLTNKQKLGRKSKTNPCIDVWGPGPEGKQCGTCAFFAKGVYQATMLYKCKKRGMTHGAGTDHKVRYPACAKYEERQES